MDRFNFKK